MTLAERLRTALAEGRRRTPTLLDDNVEPSAVTADRLHQAAVLIAVTDRAEPGVLLTRRPETMRRHAGQVAFPGGRIDPDDADAIDAALREADEEIGLPRAAVEIVGVTDTYHMGTGFIVTPVLAVVPPDLPLVPHEVEVAAIFEVPLGHVFDPANHLPRTTHWQGRERRFVEIAWQDERIWGATAAMLVNLGRRLEWRR